MTALYSNENFPLPAVVELRRLGHDALTTADAGMAGRSVPDDQVLLWATAQGRAVLTLNRRHFVRLLGLVDSHAGIVVCSFDADFGALASRIDAAIRGFDSLDGALVRVDRPKA